MIKMAVDGGRWRGTVADTMRSSDMIAYVQEIARDLAKRFRVPDGSDPQFYAPEARFLDTITDRSIVLWEELHRLDPRDFVADARLEFVEVRWLVRALARIDQAGWSNTLAAMENALRDQSRLHSELSRLEKEEKPNQDRIEGARRQLGEVSKKWQTHLGHFQSGVRTCERVVDVLDRYGGPGSQAVARSFSFVKDPDLRPIVERDYKELSQTLMPDNAWKSAVVMAGSILEAVLYDLLARDPARATQAMGSPQAPTKGPKGAKVPKDITKDTLDDQWTLAELIRVSAALKLIPADSEQTIHKVVREYRNFIHPKKEIKAAQPCVEAEALLAKGALDKVCNHLEQNP